ncbi:ABC transporter permease [Geomonas nitrogeniifigens]|uniref:ABC transporter permease n=1 Tax=Geomonas diazotrophica TaxID=2843197 RepID=UPI001C2B9A63|nr:ABC transporter permease [Geomonas nitrogeniifigens]QXE85522.1 ABC transporter permease [Geomonas nitrogeniifigens]
MSIKDLVRITLSNISRTKPFFIANIVAISVGVLMVVVMLSLAQGILRYSGSVMKEEASANAIEITSVPNKPDVPKLTGDQVAKVRMLDGVTQTVPLVQGLFGDLSSPGLESVVVSLSSSTGSDDPEMQRLSWQAGNAGQLAKQGTPSIPEFVGTETGKPAPDKGALKQIPVQKQHSIVIPETLLGDLKFHSASDAYGKKLTLIFSRSVGKKMEKKTVDVEVAGVARKTRFSRCYLPLEFIEELCLWQNGQEKEADNPFVYDNVTVYAKSLEEVPRIRKDLENQGYRTSSVLDTVGKLKEISIIIYVFLGTLGGISLFTGSISIFNATYASVLRRVREFAIFRSYGASRRTILAIVLSESAITATIAGIVGFLGGSLVMKAISHLWLSNMEPTLFVVPPYFCPLAIVLAIVVCGSAASGPAWKAANMAPAEAIRNN